MFLNKNIRKILNSFFIISVFFITQFNFSGYSPFIPEVGNFFDVSIYKAQLTLSYGFIGYMVGQLFWGIISDFTNRLGIIALNLILHIFIALIITLCKSFSLFILLYLFLGFIVASFTSVGNAILKEMYSGETYLKMVANVGIVMALGPAIGPLITSTISLITGGNWHIVFLSMAVISGLIFLGFISFSYYKTKKIRFKITKNYKLILLDKSYWSSLLSYSLMFGILISYLGSGPYLFMSVYKISDQYYGLYYSVTTSFYLIGAIIFFLVSRTITAKYILFMGISTTLIGSILFFLSSIFYSSNLFLGILSFSIILLGSGISVPSGKAATMQRVKVVYGFGASLMKFTQSFIAVLVSAISATLPNQVDSLPISTLYMIIVLVGFIILGTMIRFTSNK